jgi:hypothetical protein
MTLLGGATGSARRRGVLWAQMPVVIAMLLACTSEPVEQRVRIACDTVSEKLCGGVCTSRAEPSFGCGADACTPCALSRVGAYACSSAGACAIGACRDRYADCDGRAENGCETSLLSTAHCGACGVACAGAVPKCSSRGCVAKCKKDEVDCGDVCLETLSEQEHCGACGRSCTREPSQDPNGDMVCRAGACVVACRVGFSQCGPDKARVCVPSRTYFPDEDGDGFGASHAGTARCPEDTTGYVLQGGDCDDGNAAVRPDAAYQADAYRRGRGTSFDYDCDGVETVDPAMGALLGSCDAARCVPGYVATAAQNPLCGSRERFDCSRPGCARVAAPEVRCR